MDTTLTEIDFISPCPVEKCKNKNKNYRWVHYNCDGREKLNDLGFIRCLKCGGEAPFISSKHYYKIIIISLCLCNKNNILYENN